MPIRCLSSPVVDGCSIQPMFVVTGASRRSSIDSWNACREADVLIMEGTNVRPASGPAPRHTETDVENDFVETFRRTGGLVATFSSAQYLDRLVTVFRRCSEGGCTLVVDLYTATHLV